VLGEVALPLPHFWLAALASLGENVSYDSVRSDYGEDGT
jgi:hypothetical protein